MVEWRFEAIDRAGRPINGVLEGADETVILQRLRRDGALPLSVVQTNAGIRGLVPAFIGRGEALTRQEVSDLTRELATMLGAGQDLDRALRFLVETAPNRRARRVLDTLREEVRNGSAFAVALGNQKRSFSQLYVGLVRAGEAGGNLAPTLERLADLLERERALTATVTSALIYPVLLVLAAIGAIVLLLVQVLPQFVPLFEQSGAALPASTQFLISTGDAVSQYGLWGLTGVLCAILAGRALLRRPPVRLSFDRLKLRLPVIGGLSREILAARLSRTLGTLLDNRVSLITALTITREVLGNAAGTEAIDRATTSARGGDGLSASLASSGVFPARLVHLLRLGEETAQLGPMALRAAAIHEESVRMSTQRLVSLLTPAITIGMGLVIAGIVSSLLLAMLSLNDLAQ